MNENYSKVLSLGYKFVKLDNCKYAINIIKPTGECKKFAFSQGLKRNLYFGEEKIEINEKTLFCEIYHLSDDDMCIFQHNYSLRTYNYLESIKKNIGFVGVEYNSDYGNDIIGDFKKTQYFVSKIHSGIDDWYEIIIYFNHSPSEQEVKIAEILIDSSANFTIGKWKEKFRCWECGCEVNWLDIQGDIFEKIACMEDRYCGC